MGSKLGYGRLQGGLVGHVKQQRGEAGAPLGLQAVGIGAVAHAAEHPIPFLEEKLGGAAADARRNSMMTTFFGALFMSFVNWVKTTQPSRQICARTSHSPDTIRFYEKMGLLPVERAGQGFKDYTDWHVVRLLQIKYAKASGFTLAQIRESLELWVTGQLSAAEKQAILAEQVQKIDQARAELQVVRQYLQEKLAAA